MGNVSCHYTLPCIPPGGQHHQPPQETTTAYHLPLHDEIKTLESMVLELTQQNTDALEVLRQQAAEVSELRRSLQDFRMNDSVGTEARAASEARAGGFTSSARRSDSSHHHQGQQGHQRPPSSSLKSSSSPSSPLTVADAKVLRDGDGEHMYAAQVSFDENNMTAGTVSGLSSPEGSPSMALFSPLVGAPTPMRVPPTPMRVPSPVPLDAILFNADDDDRYDDRSHDYDADSSIVRLCGGDGGGKEGTSEASTLEMPLTFARGTAGDDEDGDGGGGGAFRRQADVFAEQEEQGSYVGFGNASTDEGSGASYNDDDDDVDDEGEASPREVAAAEEEERLAIIDAAEKEHEDEVRTFEVGQGTIGLSFSSFSMLHSPEDMELIARLAGSNKPFPPPGGASILVTAVAAGGVAEEFGVRAGDLISAFNGVPLPDDMTKDAFFDVLSAASRPITIGFRFAMR